jgi:beta-glucosidase
MGHTKLALALSLSLVAPIARAQSVDALAAPAAQLSSCKVPPAPEPWRDVQQTPECRTLEVIHVMTLEQKIDYLGDPTGKAEPDKFSTLRLKASDGPNGIARGPFPGPPPPIAVGVTAFPNEIGVAATWDRVLAASFGKALGEEWYGKGLTEIIAPTLNIMRTWHWGRSAETYGEDPFLNGEMASAEVGAIQREHVVAMLKHFSANNQDWDRVGHFPDFTGINEVIPERALEEIYYPGFKSAVENASPGAAMCAYNQINGSFACNNKPVLSRLRDWGFSGYIVPDAVFALHDPVAAVQAGVDRLGPAARLHQLNAQGMLSEQTMDRMLYSSLLPIFRLGIADHPPTGNVTAQVSTPEHIALSQKLIAAGSVLLKNKDHVLPLEVGKVKSIAVIGAAAGPDAITGEEGPMVYVQKLSVPAEAIVARAGSGFKVTYAKGNAGLRPLPVLEGDVLQPASGEGHGLTAEYYRSSDLSGKPAVTRIDPSVDFHSLPVPELGKEVFSFAPPSLSWSGRWTSTLTPPMTGDYVFSLTGGGTSRLVLDDQVVAQLQHVNFSSTALGTIHLDQGKPVKLALEHSNDYALLGSQLHLGWYPPHPEDYAAAKRAAESSDVAIVFAGEQLGEGMDKLSLNLPGDQDALIEAIAARNPRTVVVLNTSTPVAMPWLDKVAAVLETWYPGQESGAGTAALLFGDDDPGGRLPMTFPAGPDQGPASRPEEYPGVNGIAHYDEGILVGYRWYDAHQQTPLFPFGYGLSYTSFRLSGLHAKRMGNAISVRLTVTNTGPRAGTDVVQLYVVEPDSAHEPPSQLKGFAKLSLQPGEQRQIEMNVPLKTLAAWSEETHNWKVPAGRYMIQAAESSRAVRLRAPITLPGGLK